VHADRVGIVAEPRDQHSNFAGHLVPLVSAKD
jgi:hypothetical protein